MNEKIGTILSIAGGLVLLVVLLLTSACSAATPTPEVPTATSAPPTSTPTPLPPTTTPTPAPPTATPTVAPIAFTALEDIAGIRWESGRTEEQDVWLAFAESGRYRAGYIGAPFFCVGEAWFDGGQLYLRDLNEINCPCSSPDQVGIWEVQGVPGEYLSLTVIDEPCRVRRVYERQYYLSAAP